MLLQNINIKHNIPQGMRDWLPGEAERKRELVNHLLKKISLWGYEEVNTPMLEYYQVLLPNENWDGAEEIYKLIDRDGRILVLRPEMTLPIARVASSKLSPDYPLRLMYGGEVFRYEAIQTGKQREFCQVGVELLGKSGAEADSEILALAAECLCSVGLTDFTISLGHTGFLKGLLASLSGEEAKLKHVRTLILEKDFVGLNNYLLSAGISAERIKLLEDLLTGQFSFSERDLSKTNIWRDLPTGILEALTELQEIYHLLKLYGYEQYIQVDLSTLRSQDYYTGMVFEIYTPGIGYPIGGGGRYDRLLHNWGADCPATGFALGVERILLSLPSEKTVKDEDKPLLIAGKEPARVIAQAIQCRNKGKKVITEIGRMSRLEAETMAKRKNAVLCWLEEESE